MSWLLLSRALSASKAGHNNHQASSFLGQHTPLAGYRSVGVGRDQRQASVVRACWLCRNPDGVPQQLIKSRQQIRQQRQQQQQQKPNRKQRPSATSSSERSLAELLEEVMQPKKVDPCTLSNHESMRITHMDLGRADAVGVPREFGVGCVYMCVCGGKVST